MDEGDAIGTILSHSSFGAPDCCRCINAIIRGDHVDLVCNECEAIIETVPVENVRARFDEMELSLDFASAVCPQCGAVRIAPEFSELIAFVCDKCGTRVKC